MASVSVGLNVWFLLHKREQKSSSPAPAPATHPAPADTALRALQPVEMDFSGTAFANDSWKLDQNADPAFSLDKPFAWKDAVAQPDPNSVADKALLVPSPK